MDNWCSNIENQNSKLISLKEKTKKEKSEMKMVQLVLYTRYLRRDLFRLVSDLNTARPLKSRISYALDAWTSTAFM